MPESERKSSQESFEQSVELLERLRQVESGAEYALVKAENSHNLVAELLSRASVAGHLGDLQEHHHDSLEHSLRVGLLVVDMALESELPDEDVELLGLSGLLHDLGKCDIADDILSGERELDEDERNTIRGHPRLGFIRLEEPEFEEVRSIVVGHHEHKLTAYPRGGSDRREEKRGHSERRAVDERIEGLTEILAAADIFDALASRRSYKEPFSAREIEEIMTEQFTGDEEHIEQVLRRHE